MRAKRLGGIGFALAGVLAVLTFWASPASARQKCDFGETSIQCSGGSGSGGRTVLTDPSGESDATITTSGGGGSGGRSSGDFATGEFFTTSGGGGGGRTCFEGLEAEFGIPDGCIAGGGGSGQHCFGNFQTGIDCVGGGPGRPLFP